MISVKPEEEAEELTGRQENERPFALPASLYHAALITFTDDETERERERERERVQGKGEGETTTTACFESLMILCRRRFIRPHRGSPSCPPPLSLVPPRSTLVLARRLDRIIPLPFFSLIE